MTTARDHRDSKSKFGGRIGMRQSACCDPDRASWKRGKRRSRQYQRVIDRSNMYFERFMRSRAR